MCMSMKEENIITLKKIWSSPVLDIKEETESLAL